jgi:hypothetical protein
VIKHRLPVVRMEEIARHWSTEVTGPTSQPPSAGSRSCVRSRAMSTPCRRCAQSACLPRLSRLRTVPLRQVDDRTVSGLGLLFTRPARPSVLSYGRHAARDAGDAASPQLLTRATSLLGVLLNDHR